MEDTEIVYINLEDFKEVIKESVKDGVLEAQQLIDNKRALNDALNPTETEHVIIDNLPTDFSINNFNDLDFTPILDKLESSGNDVVDFATDTDAKLYTVQTDGSLNSVNEQAVAYLLDIRNIFIIALLFFLVFQFVYKIGRTLISYTKGDL